jgi:hypothetical protein
MTQITTSTSTEIPLLKRINALETPAKQLLRNLYDAWSEAIEVPVDGKTRTAKQILHPKKTAAEIKKQEAEDREIEKELRLESYCADADAQREIRFHEDEERLYRNQITFANLIGIEFEDHGIMRVSVQNP